MEFSNGAKKVIVITTIYQPPEAVLVFAKMKGYTLVVVGNKKTQPNRNPDNVKYLSVEDHKEIWMHLWKVLPFNHYSRKMIGYLMQFQLVQMSL